MLSTAGLPLIIGAAVFTGAAEPPPACERTTDVVADVDEALALALVAVTTTSIVSPESDEATV